MKSQTEKTRRHYGVYVLATLVVALAGAYVYIVFLTRQYHSNIILTQQELLVQVERERRVRDTAGVIASLKEERAKIKNFFKTPNDVIVIIEDIEGLGKIVGAPVSVMQVQVENEDELTREGVLAVSIFSEGSWKEMTTLLGLLDALPYQAKMVQVTLDTSESEEGTVEAPLWAVRASVRIALKK